MSFFHFLMMKSPAGRGIHGLYICICMWGRGVVIPRVRSIPRWLGCTNETHLDPCVRTLWYIGFLKFFLRRASFWSFTYALYDEKTGGPWTELLQGESLNTRGAQSVDCDLPIAHQDSTSRSRVIKMLFWCYFDCKTLTNHLSIQTKWSPGGGGIQYLLY